MDRGDHNVISVDWSPYSKNMFYLMDVIPQMKIIGEAFAEQLTYFVEGGFDIANLHLVGHSLG